MNLSEILRTRREFLNFSLKAVSDDLQIPQKYLAAFEESDWRRLPARIYARGFLRKYAAYLDLEPAPVLTLFDTEYAAGFPAPALLVPVSRTRRRNFFPSGARRFLMRQRLATVIVGAVFVGVVAYFVYEFRYAIRPPTLVLESPAGNMTITEDSLPLVGRVEKDAEFRVNGRQVFADEAGVFHDMVLLRKGLNMLVFEAVNRFGKKETITRSIVVR